MFGGLEMNFKEWLMQAWQWLKALPWKRIGLISLCSVLALVFIVAIFVTAYVDHLLGLIKPPIDPDIEGSIPMHTTEYVPPTLPSGFTDPTIDPSTVTDPPAVEDDKIISSEKYPEIINIMLVGQDRRPGENYLTRSDAMILCTFNTKDKTITMTSFMRDLYVKIPGIGGNKMNAAYQFGGMKLLRQTMLENFGVYVDAFVEVDFSGFEKAVEALGGVDISLTQAEADHLNADYGWKLTAGMNHLDGAQALAYSRIRYIGNADFGRTERQRNVINAIISSCKSMSLTQANDLLTKILPLVSTDMSKEDIFDYALTLFPLLKGSIESQRIPIDGSYTLEWVGALDVVLPNIEINRQYLLDTLLP